MDAVGLAQSGVVFALGAAVHLHKMRLRLRLSAQKRGAPDVDDLVAGGADGDDVLQLLDVRFVVIAPDLVRFQPPRRAADAAFSARAGIGGAPQLVPHRAGQRAAQVRVPAPVRDKLEL